MATTELWTESRAQREGSRRRLALFTDPQQAVAEARRQLDAQLAELHQPGQAAARLIELWLLFGDDCYLVPAPAAGFSSADHVRSRAPHIAGQ